MGPLIDFSTGKVIESPLTAPPPPPEPKKPYVPAKRKPASLPVENRRAELAKIHVAKKQLAMDEETYRTMLMSQFGVESARDLSAYQRKSCILYMQRLGFEGKRGKGTPQRLSLIHIFPTKPCSPSIRCGTFCAKSACHCNCFPTAGCSPVRHKSGAIFER